MFCRSLREKTMNAPTTRRQFLGTSLAATAAASLARAPEAPADEPGSNPQGGIIDTNAYISRWPFRRLPGDEPGALAERLKARGVVQAWAGSFDGVFHKDIAAVNARLAEACRSSRGFLVPFGSVNPTRPDWREDLRRCSEDFAMPGIRLHPAYHGYRLDDPAFDHLLDEAQERRMVVQVAAWMEDPRQQNTLMPVPEVDLTPLADRLKARPKLRLVVLNGFSSPVAPPLLPLFKSGLAWFDIARLEVLDGLNQLLESLPLNRTLFGSYAPMFYFDSSLLKLTESGIEGEARRSLLSDNARSILS
jgi:hypothetical protein